ncbi:hypothetical protein V8C37DRAFT_20553 [Trichoderma ceciliae]
MDMLRVTGKYSVLLAACYKYANATLMPCHAMPCHARQITSTQTTLRAAGSTDLMIPHPQLDDAPATISIMFLDSATAVRLPFRTWRSLPEGYSRWASVWPGVACSLDDQYALPRWDLAPLEISLVALPPPLFAKKKKKKKKKKSHTHKTHTRILSHPVLNYIKVHLTPTNILSFPPRVAVVSHFSLSSGQPFVFAPAKERSASFN